MVRLQPVTGDPKTVRSVTDSDGSFVFELPVEPLTSAVIGAEIEGATTVDLELDGRRLDPGDVVVIIDDLLPSHLRYA